jgi:hypothetical protein
MDSLNHSHVTIGQRNRLHQISNEIGRFAGLDYTGRHLRAPDISAYSIVTAWLKFKMAITKGPLAPTPDGHAR